ncbi:unnamed protein product [Alopecurus aequalis]
MAARRITAAAMATIVALVLFSSSTGGEGATCGSHPCAGPCPVPDICAGSSNDACAAWCISEKYDTGACYGDPKVLRICMCESPC